MDQFRKLREIQKKERNNGTLARVEETFYNDIHDYLDGLKKEAINDPFSNVTQVLHEAQRIATEICERREHKIANAAVVNIHRSYHLFTGTPQFDLVDTTPLNLTPEEEKFYFSLIETLRNHRGNISMEKLSEEDEDISDEQPVKPVETQTSTLDSPKTVGTDSSDSKPQVVKKNETPKQVEKPKPVVKPKPIAKPAPKVQGSIEENPNAFDENEEFYDLESRQVAKDTELVTMLVFDEVGQIIGVDEKIYGPFRPQDLVTLPLINAKVFFKNRKGRQVKI